jgi:hypothetical protein
MKGLSVKLNPLERTARYWVARTNKKILGKKDQQEAQSKPGTRA